MTARKNKFDKYFTNSIYSFFLKQLAETGLSLESNQFSYVREGIKSSAMYLSPDKDGNVRFIVPDIITGDLETFVIGTPPHQKTRDWYLTRWKKPQKTKLGLAKYTPAKGSGTRCLFTKPVVDSFNSKKQIKTLFIIEGFKKALAGATIGNLPIIGMNGLTGFKEPGSDPAKLRPEIRQILTNCKVQNVVVINDSDIFDLGKSKDKPASQRPNQFYRAALMARILFEPFADVYLSFPNPHPYKKYGLDDLLHEHRTSSSLKSDLELSDTKTKPVIKFKKFPDNQKRIINNLLESVKTHAKTKFFTTFRLSAMADFKIKEIFHLSNVQAFYEFHRDTLRKKDNLRFRYYTRIYQIQGDGTLAETEADTIKHLNISNHFGKLVRETDKGKKELANFTMKVLFQIDSEDDPKRIVEITNYDGVKRTVEISSKTFVSLGDFQALMISYGDFIFKGTKEDLLDIMTILFQHEKPAMLVSQLGWQPVDDFYAFSNGIVTGNGFTSVDEYGMVSFNEVNYYFPAE